MANLTIFVYNFSGGGAERAMVNLARGFSERGLSVDLVVLAAEGAYRDSVPPEVQIINLGGQRLLRSVPALTRYLRQAQPQVMLSTMSDANIVAIASRLVTGFPTRLVVNVQNTISQEIKSQKSQLKAQIVPHLVRWLFPKADAIVPVSHGVADDLKQMGLPAERIQVIHNPVVTPELLQAAQAPVDHPWFAEGQPPVLTAVGRLSKQKDFPTLLKAFAEVRKQRPVKLLVLGEGEDRAALENLAQQLQISADVSFPGFVSNPFAYLAHSALFVLSSLFEGLPTVLIEAMAVGTPVVSTDCKSGPMEILAGGHYGKLTPVGDVEKLALAIIETLEQPPSPELLRERAQYYSLEKSLDDYSQILHLPTRATT